MAHATVRGLLGEWTLAENETVLLDMEASIEHLSRGTVRHADTLVIIVEPYYRALETAGRIAALAPQLKIPRMIAVGNKIRTPDDEQAVRAYCSTHGLDVAALIPFEDRVTAADREGLSFLDIAPDSVMVEQINILADKLSEPLTAARVR
ncbi:MAG: hypothetical protein M3Z07_03550 [Candidatus Eremiobacteraeota bacterium]|nr:hypothetical protein [Candidatus Eremiobacteraeota bacterium]